VILVLYKELFFCRGQVGRSGLNLEPGTMRVYVTNGPRNGLNIGRKVGLCPGSRRRWVLGSVHAFSQAVYAANTYRPRFQVGTRPSYHLCYFPSKVMICLPPQGTPPPHSSRYGPQHTQHTASTAATPHYPQGRRQTPADAPTPLKRSMLTPFLRPRPRFGAKARERWFTSSNGSD